MKNKDLIALLPVDKATAKKKGWSMPWPSLYRGLKAATMGRILAVDDKIAPAARNCPSGADRKIWKKFQNQVLCNGYFFELEIS